MHPAQAPESLRGRETVGRPTTADPLCLTHSVVSEHTVICLSGSSGHRHTIRLHRCQRLTQQSRTDGGERTAEVGEHDCHGARQLVQVGGDSGGWMLAW